MDVAQFIAWHGGAVSWSRLVRELGRRDVDQAIATGRIARARRGVYTLPESGAVHAAASVAGVISHLSAALHYGWAVKAIPECPHVTVPRNRHVRSRRGVVLHFGDPMVDGMITTPVQTVVDCARTLPRDEALAVADSALRAGTERAELIAAALASPRTGRSRALEVIEAADGRADNPFESVIRCISHEFPSLHLVPQVEIAGLGRPDLYDAAGLVVECDSFQFHSKRAAVVRDVERYNACQQLGLGLLRFAWEHAMLRQDYVREQFSGWLAAHGHAVRR